MIIIRNIPGFMKLYGTLRHLNKYKKEIEDAKAKGDFERERLNIRKAESDWSSSILKIFDAELVVHGKENLPKEGPIVYVANHQGYADIIAYCAALDTIPFGYIAKQDLVRVPAYGAWIKRVRSVLIKREDPRESLKAIDEGIDLIHKGFSMMIFPEGTRSKGPEPGEFKRGAFKLATKPGVPIIPVSLHGSYKMYEETGRIKRARIDVIVHPRIETKGLSKKEEKQMCLDVEKTIKDGIKKLQQEHGK